MAQKHVIIAGEDGTLYRVHLEGQRVEKIEPGDPDHAAAQSVVSEGKPHGFVSGEGDQRSAAFILNKQILTKSILTHVVNLGAKPSDDD